jgi:hypothetical protein
MLFTSPYETRLLARDRARDGIRAAERAQLLKGVTQTEKRRRGPLPVGAKLMALALSLLALVADNAG